MLPKVSILIPCYNADRWIAQAIQSALDQTYLNKEVIVVDDGSSDRSLEIIKSFGDRIRWETQPNQGGNVTRNRLLALSSGDWLQYLDADDYLLSNKIEKQIQFLSDVPQTDIIYSPGIDEYHESNLRQELASIPKTGDSWTLLVKWQLPQTGRPLWRKQALVDVGGWKDNQPCCQEHDLYLRMLMAGKRFEYFEGAGSVYRIWSSFTVCNKNLPETYRRRLEIIDRAEQHLNEINELTQARQAAISQSRFECARSIWLSNRPWAVQVVAKIHETHPKFVPSGQAAPLNYTIIYKLCGFTAAEILADSRRRLSALFSFPQAIQS